MCDKNTALPLMQSISSTVLKQRVKQIRADHDQGILVKNQKEVSTQWTHCSVCPFFSFIHHFTTNFLLQNSQVFHDQVWERNMFCFR